VTAKELPEISLIPPDREQQAFAQVVELIRLARERAMASVNTTLIDLHWQVGEFSRSLSPALVAEYQTRLPDKKMLQAKLREFYALSETETP